MPKKMQGEVTSNRMAKTVVVEVVVQKRHAKYHKRYTTAKKYKAHDETGEYQAGDVVEIEETRPISKEKQWKVIRKVK